MPERSICRPIVAERRHAARDTPGENPPVGPIGMFVATGAGHLSRFDPVFARLLALHTRPVSPRPLTLGRLMGAAATQALDQARHGAFASADCALPDGRTMLLRVRRSVEGTRGWVEDVSALRRTETGLRFAALHDPLTGLMNRRGLQRHLADVIARSAVCPVSLVFMDLDGFKPINDVFGHAAGDSVLRQFSTRMRELLKPGDFAARVGGDEFVVALSDRSQLEADAWIRLLEQRMSATPFRHFAHEFALQFSAGCLALDPTLSPDAALEAADRDCARVKSGEHTPGKLIEPSLLSALAGLHHEAECPGLELLEQGVHGSQAGRPRVGAEWLLRLRDGSGRLRRPSEFLPAARQLGLAAHIDLWVMRRALEWITRARSAASSNAMFVVMKLNAESLHDRRFQRRALRLLKAQPSTAAALRIEVNARHLARGPGAAAEFIERARAMGTRAVLGGLAQVPVWMPQLLALRPASIKLDVSLADIDREQPTTHQSIRLLLDHCRALGIEACATRIESTRALEWACRVGFDQVQGFLLGKPDAVVRATQRVGSGSAASAS